MRGKLFILLVCSSLVGSAGCSLVLPEVTHQPVIRNPFPQLSRVAVAPFFNHSDEATVDGRQFALAYFSELQATPGFEVVPLGVVEEAILEHRIDLNSPGEARRLAKLLGVDAVAVGAVTDFSPYYPPRCGLRVEWYTANRGFHEIPTGYGLPWNTPEEEFIPDELIYASQMSLARAQMATQSPDCDGACQTLSVPPSLPSGGANDAAKFDPFGDGKQGLNGRVQLAQAEEELPAGTLSTEGGDATARGAGGPTSEGSGSRSSHRSGSSIVTAPTDTAGTMTHDWPDESCFMPAPAFGARPPCVPNHGPVLSHTRIYHGHDPHLTQALQSYVYFRDDARFGGWESYLQRSDDFIRFCCHMHISEMLSARGGSRKTRVVWRWPESR